MADCPWRALLLLALAIMLIGVVNIVRNELTRRELRYSAAVSMAALDNEAFASMGAITAPSRTVGDFTKSLSEEEQLGWTKTPRYTPTGYRLAKLPKALRQELLAFHEASLPVQEESSAHLKGDILLASLGGTALEARLAAFLQAALEEWTSQEELVFINSYGPRTYKSGATLAAHGDRIRTHAVSAIVFVQARNVEKPWPLQFVANGAANDDPVVDVFLSETADVLLYESTQPHGRVEPLRGEEFTAVFFHWRPAGWDAQVRTLLGPQES